MNSTATNYETCLCVVYKWRHANLDQLWHLPDCDIFFSTKTTILAYDTVFVTPSSRLWRSLWTLFDLMKKVKPSRLILKWLSFIIVSMTDRLVIKNFTVSRPCQLLMSSVFLNFPLYVWKQKMWFSLREICFEYVYSFVHMQAILKEWNTGSPRYPSQLVLSAIFETCLFINCTNNVVTLNIHINWPSATFVIYNLKD